MSGYNFTERVRHTLGKSRERAAALDHEYVGTEHILLGLLTALEYPFRSRRIREIGTASRLWRAPFHCTHHELGRVREIDA